MGDLSAIPQQPGEHPLSADVLAAAQRGDNDAFAALVTPYVPRLKRLARRFTRNVEDAEDVCQESLLKAFTKLHHFKGSQVSGRNDFRSWLMKIAANSAIDFMRRKQSCRFVPLQECDPIASESYKSESRVWKENPEASCARKERLQMLADTITQLPRDLRDVCVLRNVIGLSTREVATRLEISTIAVRLRLFRAHVRLRSNVGVASNHGGQSRRTAVRRSKTRSESSRRNPGQAHLLYQGEAECAYGD